MILFNLKGSADGLISCWDPASIHVEEIIKGPRYIVLAARINMIPDLVLIGIIECPNGEHD